MGLYDFTNANLNNKLQNRISRLEKAFARTKGGLLQATSSGTTPIPADPQVLADAPDGATLKFDRQTKMYIPQ